MRSSSNAIASHRLRFAAPRVNTASISAIFPNRVKSIRYLLDIGFFLALVDIHLDLLDFSQNLPLIIFGIDNVSFMGLYLSGLFLQ